MTHMEAGLEFTNKEALDDSSSTSNILCNSNGISKNTYDIIDLSKKAYQTIIPVISETPEEKINRYRKMLEDANVRLVYDFIKDLIAYTDPKLVDMIEHKDVLVTAMKRIHEQAVNVNTALTPSADRQAALNDLEYLLQMLHSLQVPTDIKSGSSTAIQMREYVGDSLRHFIQRAALSEPALVEYIDANSLKLKPNTSGILHDDDNRAEEDRVYWYNKAIDKLSTQFHFVKKAGG